MNIYIAGSFNHRTALLLGPLRVIQAIGGYKVVSRWIWSPTDTTPAGMALAAKNDMDDLGKAHLFILDNTTPSSGGGMHVEFALAMFHPAYLQIERPLWLIGQPTNPFHYDERLVRIFDDWPAAYEELTRRCQKEREVHTDRKEE